MSLTLAEARTDTNPPRDHVVVVAAAKHALELLRIAALRSDDVTFVAETVSAEARRYAAQFAIHVVQRPFVDNDLAEAAAVLLSLPDPEIENQVVRSAWRSGVPVHVVDRPLVSDLTVMELLERSATPAGQRTHPRWLTRP